MSKTDDGTPLYYQSPLPQGELAQGQVILRDGTVAELRPVRPEDRELVVEFLNRVSKEARVRRFFGNVSPAVGAVQLLKQGDPGERLSLIVLSGADAPRIVAHGEYIRDERGADGAEVAFIVDDTVQGKGLGTLLLERLALVGVRHGVRHFYAPTEATNRQMRALFRKSGFPVQEDRDGGYVDVSFSILPSEESVERFELRERIATVASLRPFFKPAGVAVVGASRDPESIGYRVLRHLIMNRFNGPVYPVNPHAEVVGSVPAYSAVTEVPGQVDLAVVVVPKNEVLGVVDECGKKGVRSLVIVSAGFAETGEAGRALQREVLSKARGYGMRVVGPNCLGILSTEPEVRLNATLSPSLPERGSVALASQSGALGLAVLERMNGLGLGLSSFVSLGNTADVSGNDLVQYWEDDPDTKVILLYLETFGNPRRFARLARRIGRKKPILVVKSGRGATRTARPAAAQANETAVSALFHQAGIVRAETLEEMFDVTALLAGQALPQGPNVAVVTNAGGPASLAVDALLEEGLNLPEPTDDSAAALREVAPDAVNLANPIDLNASATAEGYRKVLKALFADERYHALLVLFIPVDTATTPEVARAVVESVGKARAAGHTKPVVTSFMVGAARGALSPLPCYPFPEAAARALGQVWRYAAWRGTPLGVIPDPPGLQPERARAVCSEKHETGGGWLLPSQIEEVLGAFGLPSAAGETVESVEDAVRAADALGYPVVVKLVSTTLVNKSEWNGVKVNLKDADGVRRACKSIRVKLEAASKLDELHGYLVQPFIPGGTELVVGVTDDELFGPLVMFGLGGIHVEILQDLVFRITPLTDRDVDEMVTGIRGYKLLQGYRGAPEADTDALKDLLLRVSRLVEEVPEIAELELNPVKAFEPGQGCTILDARIRIDSVIESLSRGTKDHKIEEGFA